mmetsp:Transcript_24619/g.59666  ORF Transcript_24619/g.59666 Transcript_24619/m.59666 type:complete len:256 (+) Transcript_24619:367-1134(+)
MRTPCTSTRTRLRGRCSARPLPTCCRSPRVGRGTQRWPSLRGACASWAECRRLSSPGGSTGCLQSSWGRSPSTSRAPSLWGTPSRGWRTSCKGTLSSLSSSSASSAQTSPGLPSPPAWGRARCRDTLSQQHISSRWGQGHRPASREHQVQRRRRRSARTTWARSWWATGAARAGTTSSAPPRCPLPWTGKCTATLWTGARTTRQRLSRRSVRLTLASLSATTSSLLKRPLRVTGWLSRPSCTFSTSKRQRSSSSS